MNLIQFTKDFYQEHPAVQAMSEQEIEDFRRKHGMVLRGTGVPKPSSQLCRGELP